MNRRELLRFFGAGASIVPLIGGVPEIAAPAKLVQPARVEPVALKFAPWDAFPVVGKEHRITVDIVDRSGRHFRFAAKSFILDYRIDYIAATPFGVHPSVLVPGRHEIRWQLEGVTTEEPQINT